MLFTEGLGDLTGEEENFHLKSILRRRARTVGTHAGPEKKGRGPGGARVEGQVLRYSRPIFLMPGAISIPSKMRGTSYSAFNSFSLPMALCSDSDLLYLLWCHSFVNRCTYSANRANSGLITV